MGIAVEVSQEIFVPSEFETEEFCTNAHNPFGAQRGVTFRSFVEKQIKQIGKKGKKTLPDELNVPFVKFAESYQSALNSMCTGFAAPVTIKKKTGDVDFEFVKEVTTGLGKVTVLSSDEGISISSSIFSDEKGPSNTEQFFSLLAPNIAESANEDSDFESGKFISDFGDFSTNGRTSPFNVARAKKFFKIKFPDASLGTKKAFIQDYLLKSNDVLSVVSELKIIKRDRPEKDFLKALAFVTPGTSVSNEGLIKKSKMESFLRSKDKISSNEAKATKKEDKKIKRQANLAKEPEPEEEVEKDAEIDFEEEKKPKKKPKKKKSKKKKQSEKTVTIGGETFDLDTARGRIAATIAKKAGEKTKSKPAVIDLDDLDDLDEEEKTVSDDDISVLMEDLDSPSEEDEEEDDLLLDQASVKTDTDKFKDGKAVRKTSPNWNRLVDGWQNDDIPKLSDFINRGIRKSTIDNRAVTIDQIVNNNIVEFAKKNNCAFDKVDLPKILGSHRQLRRFYINFSVHLLGEQVKSIVPIGVIGKKHIDNARETDETKSFVEKLESTLERTKDNPKAKERCLLIK